MRSQKIFYSYQYACMLWTRLFLPIYPGGKMATNSSVREKALGTCLDWWSVYLPELLPLLFLVLLFSNQYIYIHTQVSPQRADGMTDLSQSSVIASDHTVPLLF